MKRKQKTQIFITLSLFSLTTLSVLALSMPDSFADTSATTTASITVSSACSITANNTSPHTATVFPGHEETEIGSTTMTVQCNDSSGSKIYAIGYSNDTFGNTNMIDSVNNSTIPTGTGTSSSNWSMKLSIPTGNTAPTIRNDATYDFTDYEVVPSDYAQVASFASAADGTNNSSFLVTYRTYIGGTQVPGTYTGKVKYTLVHPGSATAPSTYTISYADASNEGTGLPTSQTGDVINTVDVTLSSTEPTREDYTFNGWCTVDNSADTSACSGTTYDAGDTYTITNTGVATTITLYAVWESDCVHSITGYMQDISPETEYCENATGTVTDKRDNTTYRVAKLADNRIWMLDNLSLDITTLTQAELYGTGANAGKMTNASNETLGYLKGATTGTSTNKWATGAVTNWSSGYSYTKPMIAVDSTTSGTCGNEYCVNDPTSGQWSSNSVTPATINSITSIAQGKIGIYYNYCAVSAGSYCYDDSVNESEKTDEDICPYGWRLPTKSKGSNVGEFQKLYSQYYGASPSQIEAFQVAFSTPLSGFFNGGRVFEQGYRGLFWTSGVGINDVNNESTYAGALEVRSDTVSVASGIFRVGGLSVRCILAN